MPAIPLEAAGLVLCVFFGGKRQTTNGTQHRPYCAALLRARHGTFAESLYMCVANRRMLYFTAVSAYSVGKLALERFAMLHVFNVFADSMYRLSKAKVCALFALMLLVCALPMVSMMGEQHHVQLFARRSFWKH